MDRDRIIPAREIEGLIAEGHLIVIYEDCALKLDNWLDKHPGGHLAIHHVVGRDATDEIDAYHFDKTLRLMKAYRIGRVHLPWTNLEPPIRGGVHRKLDADSTSSTLQEEFTLPTSGTNSPSAGSVTEDSADVASLFSRAGASSSGESEPADAEDSDFIGGDDITTGCRLRVKGHAAAVAPVDESGALPTGGKLSREAYTAAMEQKEVAEMVRTYPSLDQETQDAIRAEYRMLHKLVKEQGLYTCNYSEYGKEAIRYAMIFSAFLYFLHIQWYIPSACFLGLFWQQVMFVAHDAGHRGITGDFITDTLIGAFVGDFCNGLSIGWWKSSHNVHHLVTNMPEHDPDNQNVPIFATSPTYFTGVYSSFYKFQFVWDAAADFLVPYQKYTYYPIMAVARFNLYFLSWCHLLSPRGKQLGSAWWTRWVEVAFMAGFWAVFGYGLVWHTLPNWPTRVAFVLVSHAMTMILHIQITLSHWGMPHSDLGPTESFPQRQLRTTMDVDCPPWLDWLHGGLQFQAIHHLFPRVPRHNLRKTQTLVREFCGRTGIKYQCYGFVDGNRIMLTRLQEVARMVDTLVQCSQHMAETGHYEIE